MSHFFEYPCGECPVWYRSTDMSHAARLLAQHQHEHRSRIVMHIQTGGRPGEAGGAKVGPLAIFATFLGLFIWGWLHSSRTPDGAWLLAVIAAALGIWGIIGGIRHRNARNEYLRKQDIKRTRAALPAPPPESCITNASCGPNEHTFSWPCAWAPGTGHRWIEFREGIRQ